MVLFSTTLANISLVRVDVTLIFALIYIHIHMAVSDLPFAGVGESGCEISTSSGRSATDALTDGYQFMKYTYDTFTQLRSSIDMPKE